MQVLYHDNHLLVVNKPSGLIVHRGWANDRHTALAEARGLAGRWVYPVHRLDRATSGVLVFALSPEVAAKVAASFAAGDVHKRYLALARGITPESGLIDHPLASTKGGERKPAQTRFERIAIFERYSLVRARPLTGRLHQLRRHLKHLSHPILGDTRYGDGAHNRLFRQRFGLHRLALHASSLRMPHPGSGEPLDLRAPIPEDLRGPLCKMGFDLVPPIRSFCSRT